MTGGAIAALVVVVIVVVAVVIALAVLPALRRRRLRNKFGPEYDRVVTEAGSRKDAEAELAGREKRHADLELRDLSPQARDGYARDWRMVQEHFVDEPEKSAAEADSLITAVMAERGYPTENYEQQAADLSVEHAATLGHYREAHLVVAGHRAGTSTEDLRQAMVHYRTVFEELIGSDVPRPDLTAATGGADRRGSGEGAGGERGRRTAGQAGAGEDEHTSGNGRHRTPRNRG
jgi:hypothetical protein